MNGRGGSPTLTYLESRTSPTTSMAGVGVPLESWKRRRLPIGDSPGQKVLASVSFTMATGARSRRLPV